MGHTRLGPIPKSRKWVGVISSFTNLEVQGNSVPSGLAEEDIKNIAKNTLEAADVGLAKAVNDIGLRYTFFLLTQIVLASRTSNWVERLGEIGIQLSDNSTLFELTAELQIVVDEFISKTGRPTDLSEMAQQAAGEALITLAGPRSSTLFGSGGDELQNAIKQLSTRKGFSELGQRFFGNFVYRYLNFYLSRITATYLGYGVINEFADISKFNQLLRSHCFQSSLIVHDFCGQWYSKTEYQEGINLTNTSRFIHIALKKLRDEMKVQKEEL